MEYPLPDVEHETLAAAALEARIAAGEMFHFSHTIEARHQVAEFEVFAGADSAYRYGSTPERKSVGDRRVARRMVTQTGRPGH